MKLRDHTTGRWPMILASLGVAPEYLRNRHMPCPGCGGHDRFRFDDKGGCGTFICGQGGEAISGDAPE
jgi:putative DNA primase/helicase